MEDFQNSAQSPGNGDETAAPAPAPPPAQPAQDRPKRQKVGGRQKGTPNKTTLMKLAQAERAVTEARSGKHKIAVEYMDDMIAYFSALVGKLQPFDANGKPREGYNADVWLRVVSAFQGFLSMRAPYESPRLSAVAIMPQQHQQRTTVNVTILNERGDKVYSDTDNRGDEAKLIEHAPMEGDEDAGS